MMPASLPPRLCYNSSWAFLRLQQHPRERFGEDSTIFTLESTNSSLAARYTRRACESVEACAAPARCTLMLRRAIDASEDSVA